MTKVFYLYPRSGLVTELRSDTLWGAICWGIKFVYGEAELEKLLTAYKEGDAPFNLTSTFPFRAWGRQKSCFFPMPILHKIDPEAETSNSPEAYRLRKKINKLKYVSHTDFNQMLQGNLDYKGILSRIEKDKSIEELEVEQQLKEVPPSRETISVTRNTIDRIRQGTLGRRSDDNRDAGQLFHVSEMHWIDPIEQEGKESKPGLFFLAKGQTEYLEAALRFYRHHGFGGDRSTGKGFFDFEVEDFAGFDEPDDGEAAVNLSLYHATPQEMGTFKGYPYFLHQVELRQGHLGVLRLERRKKPLALFREGSVFPRPLKGDIWGRNRIWRMPGVDYEGQDYGMGWMVKMKIPELWK